MLQSPLSPNDENAKALIHRLASSPTPAAALSPLMQNTPKTSLLGRAFNQISSVLSPFSHPQNIGDTTLAKLEQFRKEHPALRGDTDFVKDFCKLSADQILPSMQQPLNKKQYSELHKKIYGVVKEMILDYCQESNTPLSTALKQLQVHEAWSLPLQHGDTIYLTPSELTPENEIKVYKRFLQSLKTQSPLAAIEILGHPPIPRDSMEHILQSKPWPRLLDIVTPMVCRTGVQQQAIQPSVSLVAKSSLLRQQLTQQTHAPRTVDLPDMDLALFNLLNSHAADFTKLDINEENLTTLLQAAKKLGIADVLLSCLTFIIQQAEKKKKIADERALTKQLGTNAITLLPSYPTDQINEICQIALLYGKNSNRPLEDVIKQMGITDDELLGEVKAKLARSNVLKPQAPDNQHRRVAKTKERPTGMEPLTPLNFLRILQAANRQHNQINLDYCFSSPVFPSLLLENPRLLEDPSLLKHLLTWLEDESINESSGMKTANAHFLINSCALEAMQACYTSMVDENLLQKGYLVEDEMKENAFGKEITPYQHLSAYAEALSYFGLAPIAAFKLFGTKTLYVTPQEAVSDDFREHLKNTLQSFDRIIEIQIPGHYPVSRADVMSSLKSEHISSRDSSNEIEALRKVVSPIWRAKLGDSLPIMLNPELIRSSETLRTLLQQTGAEHAERTITFPKWAESLGDNSSEASFQETFPLINDSAPDYPRELFSERFMKTTLQIASFLKLESLQIKCQEQLAMQLKTALIDLSIYTEAMAYFDQSPARAFQLPADSTLYITSQKIASADFMECLKAALALSEKIAFIQIPGHYPVSYDDVRRSIAGTNQMSLDDSPALTLLQELFIPICWAKFGSSPPIALSQALMRSSGLFDAIFFLAKEEHDLILPEPFASETTYQEAFAILNKSAPNFSSVLFTERYVKETQYIFNYLNLRTELFKKQCDEKIAPQLETKAIDINNDLSVIPFIKWYQRTKNYKQSLVHAICIRKLYEFIEAPRKAVARQEPFDFLTEHGFVFDTKFGAAILDGKGLWRPDTEAPPVEHLLWFVACQNKPSALLKEFDETTLEKIQADCLFSIERWLYPESYSYENVMKQLKQSVAPPPAHEDVD